MRAASPRAHLRRDRQQHPAPPPFARTILLHMQIRPILFGACVRRTRSNAAPSGAWTPIPVTPRFAELRCMLGSSAKAVDPLLRSQNREATSIQGRPATVYYPAISDPTTAAFGSMRAASPQAHLRRDPQQQHPARPPFARTILLHMQIRPILFGACVRRTRSNSSPSGAWPRFPLFPYTTLFRSMLGSSAKAVDPLLRSQNREAT